MSAKLDTEILMRINPHEIKNIEMLRALRLDHIPIFDIFRKLEEGYSISNIRCGDCGALTLSRDNKLFCFCFISEEKE